MALFYRQRGSGTLPVNEAPGYEIANPIGIEGLAFVENLPVAGVLTGLLLAGVVGAGASVVVRYRRSRGSSASR